MNDVNDMNDMNDVNDTVDGDDETYDVEFKAECCVDSGADFDATRNVRRKEEDSEPVVALRGNDPDVTSAKFYDTCTHHQPRDDDTMWVRGIEALRDGNNTHVTKICLDFGYRVRKNFDLEAAAHMLRNRQALTVVTLSGSPSSETSHGLCDRLVRAAVQNPSIHTIRLFRCDFSAASLLVLLSGTESAAMALRKVHVCNCVIPTLLGVAAVTPPSTNSLLESIVNAARNHYTLTHLVLTRELASEVLNNGGRVGIPDGRSQSVAQSRLETLMLKQRTDGRPQVHLSRAIQGLLQSVSAFKLRTLWVKGFHFTADTFQPLAQGLNHSVHTTTLKLSHCLFDKESSRLLEAACHAGNHSGSFSGLLVEYDCHLRFGQFNPLGPTSRLKRLKLSVCGQKEADVALIMLAVGRSPKLEFLHLVEVCPDEEDVVPDEEDVVPDEEDAVPDEEDAVPGDEDGFADDMEEMRGSHCSALATSLPGLLTLKSIHFTLAWGRNSSAKWDVNSFAWSRFVEALVKNTSLIDVVGLTCTENDNVFDTVRLAKLARYGERNKALWRLLDSAHSLSLQLWPSLFKSMRRCEHGHRWIVRMAMAFEQQL